MAHRVSTCPNCNFQILHWRGVRLSCPSCGEHLRVRTVYMGAVFLGSLVVYAIGLLMAGVSGSVLFWALLLGPLVALFTGHITIPVAALLFPPPLERDRPSSPSLFGGP
jgi:hypothetical protein